MNENKDDLTRTSKIFDPYTSLLQSQVGGLGLLGELGWVNW